MSPGNKGIKTLATLPIAPGVTAHSIIAVKSGGSLGEGGDGMVSYRSAHIDEAASELVVRVQSLGPIPPRGDRGDPPDPAGAPPGPPDRPAGDADAGAVEPPGSVGAGHDGGGSPGSSRWGAAALVVAGAGLWGTLALHYSDLSPAWLRDALAGGFALLALLALGAIGARRRRGPALAAFAVALLGLLLYWRTIEPSHDRDWAPEVARLPRATVAGDLVTLHDIRNFAYRTETDFTPAYYDRTFDIRRLDALDVVTCTGWVRPIAHVFLTFGFGDNHVAVSVEARKERGEGYSSVQGFFKRYELIYVVGDERDLIRVRTNYRRDPPEDVYLYRTRGPVENARRALSRLRPGDQRAPRRPRFYDTLTTNCTTTILFHTRVNPGHLPLSWKVLLSGYAAEYAHEQRPARHEPAVRGAPAPVPDQRRRAGGGPGPRLLPAHPGGPAGHGWPGRPRILGVAPAFAAATFRPRCDAVAGYASLGKIPRIGVLAWHPSCSFRQDRGLRSAARPPGTCRRRRGSGVARRGPRCPSEGASGPRHPTATGLPGRTRCAWGTAARNEEGPRVDAPRARTSSLGDSCDASSGRPEAHRHRPGAGAARRHRRLLRRRDRQQDARGRHHELEPGGRAHVRVDVRGGDRTAHHDDHPPGAAAGGGRGARPHSARRSCRPLRDRAHREGRWSRGRVDHRVTHSRRPGAHRGRLQDRARHLRAEAGRAGAREAAAARAGGSGGGGSRQPGQG